MVYDIAISMSGSNYLKYNNWEHTPRNTFLIPVNSVFHGTI